MKIIFKTLFIDSYLINKSKVDEYSVCILYGVNIFRTLTMKVYIRRSFVIYSISVCPPLDNLFCYSEKKERVTSIEVIKSVTDFLVDESSIPRASEVIDLTVITIVHDRFERRRDCFIILNVLLCKFQSEHTQSVSQQITKKKNTYKCN